MVFVLFFFKGINIWVLKGVEVFVIRDLKVRYFNGKKGVKIYIYKQQNFKKNYKILNVFINLYDKKMYLLFLNILLWGVL